MSDPVAVVIEDEPQIRRFVRAALEAEGWQVHEADTARRGLTEAGTSKPDLLVLALGLPDGDGLALIRDLRGWSSVPVIVLSARVDEVDKVAALDAGADDYLTKPFGVAELLARVRANLRRPRQVPGEPQAEAPFCFGEVEDGRGQVPRRAYDGGVRPVAGPEGVVHVAVAPFGQGLGEGGIVRLLLRMEAQVLQEADAPGARGPASHAVRGQGHVEP